VEVSFDDSRLKSLCESDKELRKACGVVRAKKIQSGWPRCAPLRRSPTCAPCPAGATSSKPTGPGQLSLDLDHPYRLLFTPAVDTPPGPGGGLDWAAVTAVVVLSVTDTH
jgi:hypothetical protein